MPYSPSSSSHRPSLQDRLKFLPKKKVIFHTAPTIHHPASAFFYLNFQYARGRKRAVVKWSHASLQPVALFYDIFFFLLTRAQRGGNAVLRYAMHARCGGQYENAGIMGKGMASWLNVHNPLSRKKSLWSYRLFLVVCCVYLSSLGECCASLSIQPNTVQTALVVKPNSCASVLLFLVFYSWNRLNLKTAILFYINPPDWSNRREFTWRKPLSLRFSP